MATIAYSAEQEALSEVTYTSMCPYPGCKKIFKNRRCLAGHLRTHTAKKQFVCDHPDCNLRFITRRDFNRHIRTHNISSEEKLFPCLEFGCTHKYSRQDSALRHFLKSCKIRQQRKKREAAAAALILLAAPLLPPPDAAPN